MPTDNTCCIARATFYTEAVGKTNNSSELAPTNSSKQLAICRTRQALLKILMAKVSRKIVGPHPGSLQKASRTKTKAAISLASENLAIRKADKALYRFRIRCSGTTI